MTTTRVLTAIAFTAWMTAAWGGMPHVFKKGDTARASDVNENFNALDNRIAAVEQAQGGATRDMAEFASPYTTFTYHDMWSDNGMCDDMTRTVTTPSSATREVKEVFRNSGDHSLSTAAECGTGIGPHSVRHYEFSNGAERLTERRYMQEDNPSTLQATVSFDPGLLVFQDGMRNGLTVVESGGSSLAFADGVTPGYSDVLHYLETHFNLVRNAVNVEVNGSNQQFSDCVDTETSVAAVTYFSDSSAVVCPGFGTVTILDHEADRMWVIQDATN